MNLIKKAVAIIWLLTVVLVGVGCNTSQQARENSEIDAAVLEQLKDIQGEQTDFIITGGKEGKISILNNALEEVTQIASAHIKEITAISTSLDNNYIVSGDEEGNVRVMNIPKGESVFLSKAHISEVMGIAFSADGKMFATASKDRKIKLFDTETLELLHVLEGHKSYVLGIEFSPDSQSLVSVGGGNALILWDVSSGDMVKKVDNSHFRAVNDVSFSPNGEFLCTAGADSLVKVWDAASLEELTTIEKHENEVYSLAVSKDSTTVVSAGRDGNILFIDAMSGEIVCSVSIENNLAASGMKFSGDGTSLYYTDISGYVTVIDFVSKLIGVETTVDSVSTMDII